MVGSEAMDWWLEVPANTKKNLEELVIGTTESSDIEDQPKEETTLQEAPPLTRKYFAWTPSPVRPVDDTSTGECTTDEALFLKGLYNEIQGHFQEVITVYDETLEEAASLRASAKPLWNTPTSVQRKISPYSSEGPSPVSTKATRSTMPESDEENEEDINVDNLILAAADRQDGRCMSWSSTASKEAGRSYEGTDALENLAELVHKLWIQQQDRIQSQQQQNSALDAELESFRQGKSELEMQNQDLLQQVESMKNQLLAAEIQLQLQPQERVERPPANDNRTNRKMFYQSTLVKNDRDLDTIFLMPSRSNSFSKISQQEVSEDVSLDKNPVILAKGGEEAELSEKLKEAENKYLRAEGRLRRQCVENENLQLEIVDIRKELAAARYFIEDLNEASTIQELLKESSSSPNGRQQKQDVAARDVEGTEKPEQTKVDELQEESEPSDAQSCKAMSDTPERCGSVQVEDKDEEKILASPQGKSPVAESEEQDDDHPKREELGKAEARSSKVEDEKDSEEDKKDVSVEAKISQEEWDVLLGKEREQRELVDALREELTAAKLEYHELLQTNTRDKTMIEEIMTAKQEESVRSREAGLKLQKALNLLKKMTTELNAGMSDLQELENALCLKTKDSEDIEQLKKELEAIQDLTKSLIERRKNGLSQLSMQEEEPVEELKALVETNEEGLQEGEMGNDSNVGSKAATPMLTSFLGFVRKNL